MVCCNVRCCNFSYPPPLLVFTKIIVKIKLKKNYLFLENLGPGVMSAALLVGYQISIGLSRMIFLSVESPATRSTKLNYYK